MMVLNMKVEEMVLKIVYISVIVRLMKIIRMIMNEMVMNEMDEMVMKW